MKKNRRLLWLGWVVIMSGNIVWWTLREESPIPAEPGVLDVWTTFGDDPEPLQDFFTEYGLVNGIDVRVSTQVRSEDLEEALSSSAAPDLVILSGADPVSAYASQGFIKPLDGQIGVSEINAEEIFPAALGRCSTHDGRHLCLPWGNDLELLYWNKDLFRAAGLDPDTPPQTLEQIIEYAKLLTLRNHEGELIQAGFIPDFPRAHTDLYQQLFGASNVSADGFSVDLGDQSFDQADGWLTQFNDIYSADEIEDFFSSFTPYMTSSHSVFVGRRMSCQQCHRTLPLQNKKLPDRGFFEGHVAMMFDGSWHINRGTPGESDLGVKFGVAAVPAPASHPERQSTTVVEGPVVVLPAGAVDEGAAIDLLAWMMSPELEAQAAIASASLPSSRSAAESWRFHQSEIMEMLLDLLRRPNLSPRQSEPAHLRSK